MSGPFSCRGGCAACCVEPSISSSIPGMEGGKPAGVACVQLLSDLRCALFGLPGRPAVCASLAARADMCGASREDAACYLRDLELQTAPDPA